MPVLDDMKKTLIALAALLGLGIASWVGLIAWLDGGRLQRIAEDYLARQTGLTIRIERVSRTFEIRPFVEVRGLTIETEEGRVPLADVDRLSFSFVPWSLFRGRLGFENVVVSTANLRAEIDDEGQAIGWAPFVKEAVRIAKKYDFSFVPFRINAIGIAVEPSSEGPRGNIEIEGLHGSMASLPELTLSANSIVTDFEGDAGDVPFRSVRLHEARLERVAGPAPVRLFLQGSAASGPVRLELLAGNPFKGDPDESEPLTLHAEFGHWNVHAGGTFVANGAQLDVVAALLDARRPDFIGRLGLHRHDDGWDFHDLLLQKGRSRLTGRFSLDLAGDRPMVEGDLHSEYWQYGSAAQGTRFEWDRVESWLRRFNARVDIRADELVYEDVSLTSVSVPVRLNEGGLKIASARARLLDGSADFSATIGVEKTGGFDIDTTLEVDRLETAELLESINVDPRMIAGVQGRLELHAHVARLGDFLAQCDGRLQMTADNGSLSKALTQLGDADLVDLMLPDSSDRERTPLLCAAADFSIESGVLRTRTLIIDTPDVKFVGDGSISLSNGSVDMRITPHGKDFSLLSAEAPVRIRGTLENPDASLATGEALVSLLTPVEIPKVNSAACKRLIERVGQHVATASAGD